MQRQRLFCAGVFARMPPLSLAVIPHSLLRTTTECYAFSAQRRGNKASFGSLCEAYLSAFSLILALWLDPACSSSDKIVLEKYMSKVRTRETCVPLVCIHRALAGGTKAGQNRARQGAARPVQSPYPDREFPVAQCLTE